MFQFLLSIVFLTLVAGQFGSLQRGVFGLSSLSGGVYALDVAIFVFALVGTYYLLIKKSFKFPKKVIYLLGFLVIGCISLLLYSPTLGLTTSLVSIMYAVRFGSYILFGVVLFNLIKLKMVSPTLVYKLVIMSAFLLVLLGLIQLVLLPDLGTLDKALGWDPHKNRLVSTFFDPNFLGTYLVIALTVLLLNANAYSKRVALFLFAVLMVGLLLTFSRSAWGMFGVIVVVYSLKHNLKYLVAGMLLAISAYYLVPRVQTRLAGITDPADSAAFRLISWQNTLTIAGDRWLMGYGFNSFRFVQKSYGYVEPGTLGDHSAGGSDSSLLLVLATTGVIGFVFFVRGLFSINRNVLWQHLLPGLLVSSLFVNSLFYAPIMCVWLALFVCDA